MHRISELERKYVNEVLNSQFRSSSGAKMMKRFEDAFKNRFSVEHAVSFVNGTATMHAALEAIDIRPGDEVIVPPLTMSSTAFAVLQANATPIFADVDENTFQICPLSIQSRLSNRTRAVISVALYGGAPNLPVIQKICQTHNLILIEDNAECFLAEINNRFVGTYGDFASYSFQSSKHLTSGEGGILLVKNEKLAERTRSVQSLGYAGLNSKTAKIDKSTIQHFGYSRHSRLGWNYRMPELCCAVALAQTERIDALVEIRRSVADRYNEATKDFVNTLIFPQINHSNSTNTYWCWAVRLNTDVVSWEDFRAKYLELGGDPFYGAWKLTYLEPMFSNLSFLGRENFISEKRKREYVKGLCPTAEKIQPTIMQFKTNYWNLESSKRSIDALNAALTYYSN
jgi:perosamine synthetase